MPKSKTPSSQQRDKYADAVRMRGACPYNLWLVIPPKEDETSLLVLASDVEFQTFLYLEGSPDLLQIDYTPLRQMAAAPRIGARQFARAVTTSYESIEVELAPEGSAIQQSARRTITLRELDDAATRISSWRAIVAVINRCRSHNLLPVVFRLRRALERRPSTTVMALCSALSDVPTALCIGGVANMLRSRELTADIDTVLWSPATQVRMNTDG